MVLSAEAEARSFLWREAFALAVLVVLCQGWRRETLGPLWL